MRKSHNHFLRLVAVFKLVKAVALIFVGIVALKLIRGDAAANLTHWVVSTGINPAGKYVDKLLGKVAALPPVRFKELGAGSFTYSALFATEGIGLWLERPWGEWVTVAITGSLIPLEVYELFRRPTVTKSAMLLVNVIIVVYLIRNIRSHRSI